MMGARLSLTCLAVLWCMALSSTAAWAELGKRYALVIGNSGYANAEALPNAARDASQIAQSLSELKFEVFAGFNVSRASFERLISDFARQVEKSEAETVMIYYAGHGFELDGLNRLVPVDAELRDRSKVESETFVLDDIVASVQSPTRRTIVFLDACRDSPLPPDLQQEHSRRGLAEMRTGDNTFVAFATQPGNVSYEGAGRNSPFTEALLTHIGKPGLSLSDLMIKVRSDVATRTLDRQVPWNQSSLREQFYFNPASRLAMNDAGAAGPNGSADQPRILIGTPPDEGDEQTRSTLQAPASSPAEDNGGQNAAQEPQARAQDQRVAAVDPSTAGTASQAPAAAEPDSAAGEPAGEPTAEETEVASLDPEPEPVVERSPDELIVPLQTKLQSIGCYRGGIDGDWGPMSRAAVKRFYETKGGSAPSLEPSEGLMAAVEQESGTVCKAPPRKKAVAKKQPRKKAQPQQRVQRHQPPGQNYRSRRADEIPPWEGLYGGKIRIGVGIGF